MTFCRLCNTDPCRMEDRVKGEELSKALDDAFAPLLDYLRKQEAEDDFGRSDPLWQAVRRLYYSGTWYCKGLTTGQQTKLWEDVRDAAGFIPGDTSKIAPKQAKDADPDGLKQPGRDLSPHPKPAGFRAELGPDGVILNDVAVDYATAAFWRALGIDPEEAGLQQGCPKGTFLLRGVEVTGERL